MCIITEITTSLANRTVCAPVSTCGAWALSPWVPDSGPRSLGLGGTLGPPSDITTLSVFFGERRDLLIYTFTSWWRSTSACWTPTFRSSSCFSFWESVLTSACTLGKGPGSSGPRFPSQGDSPREARPPRPLDSWLFSSAQTMAAWTFGKYCCNKKDKTKQPGLSRLLLCNELYWEKGIWSKINSAVIVGTLLPIKDRIRQTRVSLFKQCVSLLTCSTQLSHTQAISSPENSRDCVCCRSEVPLLTRLTKMWARPFKNDTDDWINNPDKPSFYTKK